MLKIRDLGINVIPATIENGAVYEQYLDTTYGGKKGGKKPATKKPAKKPAKKAPSKKSSKKSYKASGFDTDAVAQLKRQLEERIGTEH
jgi:hypothetical protein